MERTYSDEELEAMKPENRPKIEYDGKEYDDYEATQMQRKLERTIRKVKREKIAAEAAGLKDDASVYGSLLKRLEKKYTEFSKKAGLPEQRERMKVIYPDSASKTVANAGERGIINTDRRFHTAADPMREALGSAEESHPEEIAKFEDRLRGMGVKLIRPDNEKLDYQPEIFPGKPGTVVISKGASYSAWLHEMKHVEDDFSDGWAGMRIFQDIEKCVKREVDAYQLEIDLANSIGRKDIVKRLEVLRDAEIRRYTRKES